MGNRAVACFDIDQVVSPGKHRQLYGVGSVPHFQSKFKDMPAWVHPDFNLLSQGFLTKPKREGLRLPALAVPTPFPPPLSQEAKRVASYGALPSTASVSRKVASSKGLRLAGMKNKRKQREIPRPAVVASLLPQLLLLILRLRVIRFYKFMISFICSLTIFILFTAVTDTRANVTEALLNQSHHLWRSQLP